MFSDFFFGLLPVCRQTVETQRGKNTQIKKKRIERELKTTIQKSNKYKKYKKYTNKQTNPMVDSLSTIDISQTNIRQKKNPNTKKKKGEMLKTRTYWVRKVKAADVMDDGRCRPLMISCHNFLLMTSTRPPRATTRLYSSYKSNTCLAMIGKRVIGVPVSNKNWFISFRPF